MTKELLQDKCRGCLVAGAAGDALGYEVEFLCLPTIRKRFGGEGIRRYVTHDGVAQISDDTQMSLFTLEGLLNSQYEDIDGLVDSILQAYLVWYQTQETLYHPIKESKLATIRELWSRRAPGLTCLSALESIEKGRGVINNSKGCGGVMRVAPIGMMGAVNGWTTEFTMRVAAAAADITHKHPHSSLASALQAAICKECIIRHSTARADFVEMIHRLLDSLKDTFTTDYPMIGEFVDYILTAVSIANSTMSDTDAIRALGEGWVGDEALAIALLSVIRHIDSIERCLVCAVNHDGDSDSTGAVAGNIIGAIHGYAAIPVHLIDNLELEPIIVSFADRLIR